MNSILVAITDPNLHPEVVHIAAASGHKVIDTTDPREISRYSPKAQAIIVDEEPAHHVGALGQRPSVFYAAPDPGPINWEDVAAARADEAFILPAQATELLARLGQLKKEPYSSHASSSQGRVIACVGIGGGVGANTLSAACAYVSPQQTTLIDGDAYSGGIDLLCGIEQAPGARWPDLNFDGGSLRGEDIRRALPRTSTGCAVLSAARSTVHHEPPLKAVTIGRALRDLKATPGLIIADLPAHIIDSIEYAREILSHCDQIVLLVAAEIRSVSAAVRRLSQLESIGIDLPITIVVRHRGWSGLDCGEIEDIMKRPVFAELSTIPRLAKSIELSGLSANLPRNLRKVAEAIVEEVQR